MVNEHSVTVQKFESVSFVHRAIRLNNVPIVTL